MSVVESIDYIFATKNVVRYALLYYLSGQSFSVDLLSEGIISLPRATDNERHKIFFYFMLKKFGTTPNMQNTSEITNEMTQQSKLREKCCILQAGIKAPQLVNFDQAQNKEWCIAIERNEAARSKGNKDAPQLDEDNGMKRLCHYERDAGKDGVEDENYKFQQE
jgi:hypothetical protein